MMINTITMKEQDKDETNKMGKCLENVECNPFPLHFEMNTKEGFEDELLHLLREFKEVQYNRGLMKMPVHPNLKICNRSFRTIKREYKELRKNVKVARSGAHKNYDRRMVKDLEAALKILYKTEQEIETEHLQVSELGYLIRQKKKEINLLRKQNCTELQESESKARGAAQLLQTENRLGVAVARFDDACCQIRNQKRVIDGFLKERLTFISAWEKAIESLITGKKYLMDLVEQSSIAYDQRDEWVNKLRSLKERGKINLTIHVQEMRELTKSLHHHSQLHDFLVTKGITRITKDATQREEQRKAKDMADKHSRIMYLKHMLENVKEYTGENLIKQIAKEFEKTDFHNMVIFTTMMSAKIETQQLFKEISEVKSLITERVVWINGIKGEQDKKLEVLNQQLQLTTNRRLALQNQIVDHAVIIRKVLTGVSEMLKMIQNKTHPLANNLGGENINICNVVKLFRFIERHITENVALTLFLEKNQKKPKSTDKKSALKHYTVLRMNTLKPNSIDLLVPSQPCSVCLESREFSKVSDEPEKVLSREEMLEKISAADEVSDKDDLIHNLSDCKLPRSRYLLQKRYL